MIALTRAVAPSIIRCLVTHVAREPIDVSRAVEQHRRYEQALERHGWTVRRLPAAPELPDSVFVEDAAVVLPEIAVITRPGAESRRAETEAVADGLRTLRALAFIESPATLDGGDVLCLGSDIYVGRSERTNTAGIDQLRAHLAPLGYHVYAVPFRGCLHLKSAVTRIADRLLLLNPEWVAADSFSGFEAVAVDPLEPMAANALLLGDTLLYPAAFSRTAGTLARRMRSLELVEADELAKAEGGLTCCSILVSA